MKQPKRRSLEQNRFLWSMLSDLANQLPWPVNGREVRLSPDDWKTIMTAGLTREQRVAQGIDGGWVLLGRSTSRMSVQEMSDLLELITAFGNERGVIWSEPDAEP